MSTGEDEPLSGLNGRLRPRKSAGPSIQAKAPRKSDGKNTLDRVKETDSPAKTSPNKPDDLSLNKPDTTPTLQQFLCPYCDRKFSYKQTVSKHTRRVHLSASKQEPFIVCLFCNHNEVEPNEIIRHMVDSHPNQYFACLDCHTRFLSTSDLAEHKLNVCEKQKPTYRNKLRQKTTTAPRRNQKKLNIERKEDYRNSDGKDYPGRHGFNGIVISCELKPAQVHDEADIEDNITTNLILPSSKSLGTNSVLEKNAVIVLDDIQWNKRMPPNFTFHNTDADQILSRLGVVHRSPRTGESTRRDWFKSIDETTQKFEKCFDTSFYSKVASNVQENLAKFLDGSFNFNPDPDSTIKTRKSKNSVIINTAEGFPILLAYEQYSRNVFDGYMPRAIAPKHKWKWDNLENDKNILNPDQIKRDSHANDCIITLVSSLDIWTQLCMKRKFEEKFNVSSLQKKTEKQNIIGKELKEILESREIPTSSSQVVKYTRPTLPGSSVEFPGLLGLTPAVPQYEVQPAILSGEWVRPRCYVCCACGAQTRDSRALSSHISSQHPNAQVQHYEIVGEMLLNADISKHLYVPPSQVTNRTRPMRGFRECTKCKKSVTLEDLHQHMLDCAGDTPTVRRKCRYRPFGVRRRRPRLPDNTIRKKIRKDIRSRQRQKRHIRTRPRIRTEVGDAETIRKMIADLPAKRHRVLVNPMNSSLRPRKKLDKQRNTLVRKQMTSEDQRIRRARIKETNNSHNIKETSSKLNEDSGNNIDDDDNMPLKPRPKRIPAKARQNEVLKRKTMLNRAKRKALNLLKKSQDLNTTEQPSKQQINLSRDNMPQRVDVNGGPVNTREHSGRGGPNNRGDQPGGSRQENNPNNAHVPVQNVPLKHSIASLTADSETHDKSVQFHHLFLVQQECNNVTQHEQSERKQLFENEAAVTRLDKPPLAYSKPHLDPVALQKSKLNKPRKGLNDCIAMLKNKLVDPISPSTGQVSVQCGSDEPLDMEPIMVAPRSMVPEPQIDLRPAEIYSRHSLSIPEKSVEIKPVRLSRTRSAITQRSSSLGMDVPQKDIIKISSKKPALTLEVISPKQKQTTIPMKRKSNRLRSASCVNHQQNMQSQLTSLSPRLDPSRASQMAQALLLQLPQALQLPQVTQIAKNFNEATLTSLKSSYLPRNSNQTHNTKTNRARPRRESSKKSGTAIEIVTKQRPVVGQPPVRKPSPSETKLDSGITPESERTIYRVPLTERVTAENFSQAILPKSKTTNFISEDNGALPLISPELLPQQVNRRVSDDINVTRNFSDIPAGIPPAHSSTSIEFIPSAPLDLSGKSLPLECPESQPNLNDIYTMHTYTTYETLDLSNKNNSSEGYLERDIDMSDVVVDLSLKSSELKQLSSQKRLVQSCSKLTSDIDSNSITDLSMRPRQEEYIPTDLSMKNKFRFEYKHITPEVSNYDVRDLSSHKMFILEEFKNSSRRLDAENINISDVPTDLSGKNTHKVSSATDCNINANNISVDSTLKNITEYSPADLSGKKSVTIETLTDLRYTIGQSVNKPNTNIDYTNTQIEKTDTQQNNVEDTDVKLSDVQNVDVQYSDIQNVHVPNNQVQTTDIQDTNVQGTDVLDTDDQDVNVQGTDVQETYVSDTDVQKTDFQDTNDQVIDVHNTDGHEAESQCSDKQNIDIQNSEVQIHNVQNTDTQSIDLQTTDLQHNDDHKTHTKDMLISCKEDDVIKYEEKNMTNYSNVSSQSMLSKPVYDPTLKIPQYKIKPISNTKLAVPRSNSALVRPSYNTAGVTQVSSSVAPNFYTNVIRSTQDIYVETSPMEKISHGFVGSPIDINTITGTIPIYTFPNTGSSIPVTRFESTKAVYTLANACISVTKIDTSNSATLTNTLLSVPGTTIASTTSVYTLAGTTVGTPMNYGNLIPNALSPTGQKTSNLASPVVGSTPSPILNLETTNSSSIINKDIGNTQRLSSVLLSVEQDPETAKKIAMLPKELVEILGTMPAGHRNQLLNVLPQYVSTSAAGSGCTSQEEVVVKSFASTNSSCEYSKLQSVNSPETRLEISSKHAKIDPITQFTVLDEPLERDNKHSITLSNSSVQNDMTLKTSSDDIKPAMSNLIDYDSRSSYTNDYRNKQPLDSITGTTKNILPKGIVAETTIIDLTEDETSESCTNNLNVRVEERQAVTQMSIEESAAETVRHKSSNKKTASLRAVRIKAPSERNKLNVIDTDMHPKNIMELPSKSSVDERSESMVTQRLDSDKTLAVQQAEISSTQHNIINKMIDFKRSSISPVDLDSKLELNDGHTLPEITIESNKDFIGTQTPLKSTSPITTTDVKECNIPVNINQIQNILTPAITNVPLENHEGTTEEITQQIIDKEDTLNVTDTCDDDHENKFNKPIEHTTSETKPTSNIFKYGDDEDSEDDISLAVIVKQKRLDQEKSLPNNDLLLSQNDNSTKKKKNKKLKKCATKAIDVDATLEKAVETTILDNTLNGVSICDEEKCLINKDDNCNLQTTKNSEVHSMTEDNKCYSGNMCKTELYKVDIQENSDKTPQCNKQIVNQNETVSDDDKVATSGSVRTKKKPDILETSENVIRLPLNVHCTTVKETEVNEDAQELKMKQTSAVCNVSNETNSSHCKEIQDQDKGEFKKVNNPCLENNEPKENSQRIVSNTILDDAPKPNKEYSTIPPCKEKLEKVSTTESNTNVILEDEEKSDVIPLRRSRRGKSMFTENISGDNIVLPEVSVEHKAPLTKKQLIFFKLLQDEENQPDIKASVSSEKILSTESSVSTVHHSRLPSEFQTEDSCTTSSSKKESIKPMKRKKSPQTKRRTKKKKSLDTMEIEDGTDNSQSIDNSIVLHKDAEEKHIKPNKEIFDDSTTISDHLKPKTIINEIGTSVCANNENTKFMEIKENEDNLHKSIENVDILKAPILITEKRKLSLPTVTADIGHLPKIKKTKLNKNEKWFDEESVHEEHKLIDYNIKIKDQCFENTETRTACYNRPARRTRSKSVFAKSSVNDFYDPYDIDMDEMIEKPEPFSKQTAIMDKKIVADHKVISTVDNINSSVGKICTSSKNDNDSLSNLEIKVIPDDPNHISDSDDSSKSDIPLKKYIEEKEKKMQIQENRIVQIKESEDDFDNDQGEMSDDKQNEKEDRKNRRTLAVFNNADAVATSTTESEEQLRSEQFMESFGFFSERKPRKSNLLATKKISETFHLIANESEDYYGVKERQVKKSLQNENRKSTEREGSIRAPQHSPLKKAAKRGRKKKSITKIVPCYCSICKKEFRRSDNYLRHQMSLLHISKLCEVEMKVKTAPVHEEPNYLIVYKQHLDRLKILTDKLAKRKKNSKSVPKITLPTMEEIVAEVSKTVRDQQLSQRGLSRDEALFLDCCELLKESHKNDMANTEVKLTTDLNAYACGTQATICELDLITERLNEDGTKSDGDVDSITAKNILESEEVRNLENDLISGLKEAANASNAKNVSFPRSIDDIIDSQHIQQNFSNTDMHVSHFSQIEESFEHVEEVIPRKQKKHTEVKEKMYPDIIESIDMFEDKFDKIKRKCRSQAAAAKQAQIVVEATTSYKGRKKSDKKKGKKSSKKKYQSTQVLTKGALKGFDGIKVSIPTSDINMSCIVPTHEVPPKKKKKNNSKKKREKKVSESSGKYDSDNCDKNNSSPQRKVDVYEFMDNEDAELFEFRPSTLMERFKSMSNKDTPSTSKFNPVSEDADMSSDSISDGDDFVYMSDDYVCSDDETENSLLSCELSAGKINTETKKTTTSIKRKDVYEKNAVMGKIFKHNAVRTEKKSTKIKETVKPKTNLDQLFDSLLEEEPSSSMLNSDVTSPRNEDFTSSNNHSSPHNKEAYSSVGRCRRLSSKDQEEISFDKFDFRHSKRYNSESKPSNSKRHDDASTIDYGPSTSKKHDIISSKVHKSLKKRDSSIKKKHIDPVSSKPNKSLKYRVMPQEFDEESTEKLEEPSSNKLTEEIDMTFNKSEEQLEQYCYDEAGVARQRARRKCTVGKQNVLAETWSSESEPDGVPPRPNSTESLDMGSGRRKKGKKKEGSQSGTRRGSSRQVMFRKQDVESRVTSSSRNTWSGTRGSSGSRGSTADAAEEEEGEEEESLDVSCAESQSPSRASAPVPSTSGCSKVRPRASAYYWSSEGDEEQEHLQQHGWIVGDSHKKLVTMLAHAKGRKRNNDDKRHLVE